MRAAALAGSLAAAFLLGLPASAQEEGAPAPADVPEMASLEPAPRWAGIRVGLKAGATWSTLRGELELEELGSVPFTGDFGFAVGASVEFPLSRNLSLEPSAFLVRKFSRIELESDVLAVAQKLSVNYVEFPLLLKWYPGDRSGVQGNLVFGAMPSLRLDATREIRTPDNIVDVDAKHLVRGTDWAVVMGFGFEFEEQFGSFRADLRYSHGLRNIGIEGTSEGRWSVFQMTLGITL